MKDRDLVCRDEFKDTLSKVAKEHIQSSFPVDDILLQLISSCPPAMWSKDFQRCKPGYLSTLRERLLQAEKCSPGMLPLATREVDFSKATDVEFIRKVIGLGRDQGTRLATEFGLTKHDQLRHDTLKQILLKLGALNKRCLHLARSFGAIDECTLQFLQGTLDTMTDEDQEEILILNKAMKNSITHGSLCP